MKRNRVTSQLPRNPFSATRITEMPIIINTNTYTHKYTQTDKQIRLVTRLFPLGQRAIGRFSRALERRLSSISSLPNLVAGALVFITLRVSLPVYNASPITVPEATTYSHHHAR